MKQLSRKWKIGLTLLVVTIGFCIFAELFLRWQYPELGQLTQSDYSIEEDFSIKRLVSTTRQWQHPDNKTFHEVRFNNLGLRGKDIQPKKPEGVTRVLLLGDSYTFNARLPQANTLASILEKELNEAGHKKYEVLNAGLEGSSLEIQYLFLRQIVDQCQPDIVVHIYCTNDLEEISKRKIATLDDQNQLKFRQPKKHSAKKFSGLYLLQALRKAKAKLYPFDYNKENNLAYDLCQENLNPETTRARAVFTELLAQVKETLDKKQIPLIAFLIPSPVILFEEVNAERHFQRIEKIYTEKGLPSTNLFPFFDKKENAKQLFFKNDPHWNEQGNLEMARLLKNAIMEKLK
jgi:hypothetical protein